MNCTVVMAVYNAREDWFDEALASIEGPYLLGDDGSNTVPRSFLSSPYSIHFLHRGMEPTLNDLIARVETVYVSILDCDDRRLPGTLEQQCAFLDLTPEAVAVHGRFNYIDDTGKVIRENMIHPTPCHSSLVFRKSAWEKVGGYPTGFDFGEGDSYFIERLSKIGDIASLPILCVDRRVHPNSLSFPKQPRLQRILREAKGE